MYTQQKNIHDGIAQLRREGHSEMDIYVSELDIRIQEHAGK